MHFGNTEQMSEPNTIGMLELPDTPRILMLSTSVDEIVSKKNQMDYWSRERKKQKETPEIKSIKQKQKNPTLKQISSRWLSEEAIVSSSTENSPNNRTVCYKGSVHKGTQQGKCRNPAGHSRTLGWQHSGGGAGNTPTNRTPAQGQGYHTYTEPGAMGELQQTPFSILASGETTHLEPSEGSHLELPTWLYFTEGTPPLLPLNPTA